MVNAGWYAPSDEPGIVRWWVGNQWTSHTQPLPPPSTEKSRQVSQPSARAVPVASRNVLTDLVARYPAVIKELGFHRINWQQEQSRLTISLPRNGAKKTIDLEPEQNDSLSVIDIAASVILSRELMVEADRQEAAKREEEERQRQEIEEWYRANRYVQDELERRYNIDLVDYEVSWSASRATVTIAPDDPPDEYDESQDIEIHLDPGENNAEGAIRALYRLFASGKPTWAS